MGSKNKLKRFKENLTFDNVIQPTRDDLLSGNFKLKGKWNKQVFKNNNPIVLELGCGKGEYSIGLAKKNPNKSKREKHRLINLQFIEIYKKILAKSGIIHLKTDSEFLYGYLLGLIKSISFLSLIYSNHDIYKSSGVPEDAIEIKTFYELKFLKLDKPITYIQFEFIENGK